MIDETNGYGLLGSVMVWKVQEFNLGNKSYSEEKIGIFKWWHASSLGGLLCLVNIIIGKEKKVSLKSYEKLWVRYIKELNRVYLNHQNKILDNYVYF